MSKDGIIVGFM